MLPEEVFKRRHFGTPESFFLITANYVVVAIAIQFFAMCRHIDWIFWATIGMLAFYNFYQVRRERELYDKVSIIAYCISLAGLVLMFFYSGQAPCIVSVKTNIKFVFPLKFIFLNIIYQLNEQLV